LEITCQWFNIWLSNENSQAEKKEKQVLKKAVFSLFERKSMNPTSCICSTAAWFCVSPTNQPFRDGDGTKNWLPIIRWIKWMQGLIKKNIFRDWIFRTRRSYALLSKHPPERPQINLPEKMSTVKFLSLKSFRFFSQFPPICGLPGFNGICGISMNFLTSQLHSQLAFHDAQIATQLHSCLRPWTTLG